MGFWAKYKTQYAMGYFGRDDIPFQFALAEAFTLCDAYHCSITTGTDPNRIVFWSGSNFNPALRAQGINCTTNDSEPNNLRCWPNPHNWVAGLPQPQPSYRYVGSDFTWDTLPDLLQRAGVSWHIYQDMNDNWTGAMHGCLAFASFRHAQPGDPNYEHGLTGGPDFLDRFKADVTNGTLPQVSWILPTQANSEHPGGGSPTRAGNFTAQVLDALTANPEVWSQTVFFLTFDENDGFFDHLPPPAVPSYDADGNLMGKATLPLDGEYFSNTVGNILNPDDTISGNIRPWGLSARVPMYVISPWSKGGLVNSQVFDHTSVGRFLEKRFGIHVDAISPWHRAVSGDLTTAFDFARHNDPAVPAAARPEQLGRIGCAPAHAAGAHRAGDAAAAVPGDRARATRARCPISCTPARRSTPARARSESCSPTPALPAPSSTSTTSCTSIASRGATRSKPATCWTTNGASATTDFMTCGCSAPTASTAHFKGDLSRARAHDAPNPEIFVGYNVDDGGLHLQLRNGGHGHVRFTVKSNEIYGPLLAVSASVSAAAQPEAPGFGPLPGSSQVGSARVPGFRPDADEQRAPFRPDVVLPGRPTSAKARPRRGRSRCRLPATPGRCTGISARPACGTTSSSPPIPTAASTGAWPAMWRPAAPR